MPNKRTTITYIVTLNGVACVLDKDGTLLTVPNKAEAFPRAVAVRAIKKTRQADPYFDITDFQIVRVIG